MTDLSVYVVTEIGCNSSHNDMCPPIVKAFMSKELAYTHYTTIKDSLLKDCYDETIAVHVYTHTNGETVIQDGDSVKRPRGVSIDFVSVTGG